jgi:methylphosphotriester-DNA--protein-cysteine methyltransferase
VPPPSADSKGDSAGKDQDKPAKSTAGESAEAAKTDEKTTSAVSAKSADASSIMVRIVPGITRYHKEDCLLIRFLAADDLEIMSLKSAAEEGYFACKACKPDQAAADTAS